MNNNTLSRIFTVFRITYAMPSERWLPPAWKNGVMQEIYAMPPVRTVSLFERVSPQVAAVAGVLLVLITIPCIQTAQNALTLLDTQLVDAALDSAQFFL